MSRKDEIIHLHYELSQYGDDRDIETACGLGYYSQRGYEHGTTDKAKATCKNCLKSNKIIED